MPAVGGQAAAECNNVDAVVLGFMRLRRGGTQVGGRRCMGFGVGRCERAAAGRPMNERRASTLTQGQQPPYARCAYQLFIITLGDGRRKCRSDH
jgi:hypothetical protein